MIPLEDGHTTINGRSPTEEAWIFTTDRHGCLVDKGLPVFVEPRSLRTKRPAAPVAKSRLQR
jgi:hypothetical protein